MSQFSDISRDRVEAGLLALALGALVFVLAIGVALTVLAVVSDDQTAQSAAIQVYHPAPSPI